MNSINTYEANLLSSIQARIVLLENALEEEVRNRDNIDITLLEQQFDLESDHFIAGMTRRVHQIRDDIKAHRPIDTQVPDYEIRMIQYRQLIQSSSITINRMTHWINSIFDQVSEILKNIIQWAANNSEAIVNILEQIRDAFKLIGTFFNH